MPLSVCPIQKEVLPEYKMLQDIFEFIKKLYQKILTFYSPSFLHIVVH